MNPLTDRLKSMYEKLFFTGDAAVEEEIGINEVGMNPGEAVKYFCEMARVYHNIWPDKVKEFMKKADENYRMKPTRTAMKEIKKTVVYMGQI